MLGFWEQRQLLSWSSSEDDCPPPCLGNSKLTSLKYGKTALITHLDQSCQAQLQDHALLVDGKVLDVLKDKVLWSVIIAVARVGQNKTVLELKVELNLFIPEKP